MDIEELSKSQIVLLVLLISFVTSMATGIVTVSLMDQAPTSVAQTVNRVIEQTIKEVASPGQSAAAATPVKTVVVKESDAIAGAVQKSTPSIVRLYSSDGSTFLGLGVVVDASGDIVTDTAAVGSVGQASVALANGSSAQASVMTRDAGAGIALLAVATSSVSTTTPAWVPIGVPSSAPVLGETVVLIAGESNPWIGSGLISSLTPASATMEALVKTDISGDNVLYGSPLIDTDGNLVGLSTEVSRAVSGSAFIPIAAISADLRQGGATK
jgi:S1-C subfamily serine protease